MTEKLLSEITTAQVGGPARTYIRATTEAEIVEAVSSADAANEPVLIVGGGSNLLVSDAGFDGTVVHIASTGVEELPIPACGGANVRVQAGTVWDDFVQLSIEKEWSGPAALSGIPGTVGATPVQNVGAYGVEVSEFIASVRTWDRETGNFKTFANADLRFGYRDSILKQNMVNGSPRYVVLTVDFQFTLGSLSSPIKYGELAKSLGVQVGKRAESA
ncbi:MAG: UDP-N-acetylmuramate dehydrogenase, partial [Rothia dentocariosa]